MATQFPRNLRYSPVNYLIVNWGHSGQAFNDCGLPEPQPCEENDPEAPGTCDPLPIAEAIDTIGWAKWLPEVIIGIEDPDEEIAASYVREAAIEFAKYTRCLQRQILIPLQPGIYTYPVEPYDQEQIIGLIGSGYDDEPANPCCGSRVHSYVPRGFRVTLDTARNEVHLESPHGCCWENKTLRLLVWSAPTEDACEHDEFLYERFRADITSGARLNYANALHFRDKELMQSLFRTQSFAERMAIAKGKVLSRVPNQLSHPGTLFGRRGAF